MLWLLRGDTTEYFDGFPSIFGKYIDGLSLAFVDFQNNGEDSDSFLEACTELREFAYEQGSPRQLILADIIFAVGQKKHENSTWRALPEYSGIPSSEWKSAVQRPAFVKELWPAQHLLGQFGVFKGQSAVVQMPTSAGKTKAVELILRSAFLAGRVDLAVIVAPFRALCTEIRNDLVQAFNEDTVSIDQLTDAIQVDFDINAFLQEQRVLVVTPEKLLYVLRQSPELADAIGLIVFDEGHQFDSGLRGITYELLLTSLRFLLPQKAQKLLISAVIANASAVGEWLNGAETPVVSGANLLPTIRSVATRKLD